MNTKYTVIGAGHGGKAMAAHLAFMGFQVTLFNRTIDHVAALKARDGIDLACTEGGPHGFAKLALATSDIVAALQYAHFIVLHPGRTCSAMEFTKVLRDQGCIIDVTVAKAEAFIFVLRSDGPAQARICRIKEAVHLVDQRYARFNCKTLTYPKRVSVQGKHGLTMNCQLDANLI